MTLRDAYIKIDNTLCLNQNRGNLEFNIDEDYNEDCKNPIEMVSALEIIRKYLVIDGCPLDIVIKAKRGFFTSRGFISPEHIYTIDLLNGTIDFEYLKDDGFWSEEGQVYIKDHKKTWWLREDKSE